MHQEKALSLCVALHLEAVSPKTAKWSGVLFLDQNELYTHGNVVSTSSFSDFKTDN